MANTPDPDKEARIVNSRMKLMARWKERVDDAVNADGTPLGTGEPNRHGMPQLPQGQYQTDRWPVLDLGFKPEVPTDEYELVVDGAVAQPVTLSYADLLELPQTTDTSDFHCVTTWSRMDLTWTGVRFVDLAALVEPDDDAAFVLTEAYDGYTTNVSLAEALKPDVMIAHTVDGEPLPREHGGPVRMVTPQLYAWKGAKWIRRITFSAEDQPGYWEVRGYSNTARPWREDRYS